MQNYSNIKSYDNVEKLQCNLNEKEFREYCELKIASAESDFQFIKNSIYKGKAMNVCEIGVGNGKLLYRLEKEGMLRKALGYEVSESRCNFAKKFKEYMKCEQTQIINKNFLEDDENYDGYDLIIAVDIVLQVISPLYDNAEKETFVWIKKHLNKGGILLLELEDYSDPLSQIEKSGRITSWEEFPERDVFQYGLYSMSKDDDGNIVDKKIFLNRNTKEADGFQNVIKSYSKEQIIDILHIYEMEGEIFPYYDECDDTPNDQRRKIYRVIARKM